MIDITTLKTEQLKADLQASIDDIIVCRVALSHGIKNYSGGLTEDRLKGNQHFVEVITKELARRKENL